MPHKLKAILLDMDGTLVDAFAPIVRAMKQTLHEFGLPDLSEREIRRHTGKGDCSMSKLFGAQKETATQRFMQIHDEDYITGISPLAGAEQLLHRLQRQNIPVAIVTSKGQQRAEEQLQHFGWLDGIDVVIGKVEGRASKPDPTPLLLACSMLGIPPQHSIMIGDGLADMQAAVRAQTYAAGLTFSFTREELMEAGAHATFSDLTEVDSWLQTQIR